MTKEVHERFPLSAAGLTLALVISGALANAQPNPQPLPNMGQYLTPLAPRGSQFVTMNPDLPDRPDLLVGQAVTTVVSPDHKAVLVLTSAQDSNEYLFIYDISTQTTIKKQAVQIPDTYKGIVFDPCGAHCYLASGQDDNVHTITLSVL